MSKIISDGEWAWTLANASLNVLASRMAAMPATLPAARPDWCESILNHQPRADGEPSVDDASPAASILSAGVDFVVFTG